MTKAVRIKTTIIISLTNLIIGNGFLFYGGLSSFTKDINYFLMTGMSIACILFYYLFFSYSNFEKYGNLKLILVSVLSCMAIISLGNVIAIAIKKPINDFFSNIPLTLLMGIMGNIIYFPISLIMGLINFFILTFLKTKRQTS